MKVSKKMVLIILIVVVVVILAIQAIIYGVKKNSGGTTNSTQSTSTSTSEQPASFPEQTVDGLLINGVNLSYGSSGTTVTVLVTNTTSAPISITRIDFSLLDENGKQLTSGDLPFFYIGKTLAVNEPTTAQATISSNVTSAKKIVYSVVK